MSLRLAEIFLQLVRSLSFNSKESEVLGCWAGVLPSLREQLLPLTQQFSSYLSLCVCLRRWMAPGIMELKGTMAGQFLAISNHLLFMFQTQTNSYRVAFLPDGILCSNYHPVVLLTLEPRSRRLRTVPMPGILGMLYNQLRTLLTLTLPSQFSSWKPL